MTEPALRLDEAVPLGYALVLRAAADVDVRALAIKGPVLELQGLRERRRSVDVDVIVDPARRPILLARLAELGWTDRGDYETPSLMRRHSVTCRHDRWPCELDVHDYFPGLLADRQLVFDLLWERRTTVAMANRPVPAIDPRASAAVAGLHYLRDSTSVERKAQLGDLVERIGSTWTTEQLTDLADLAVLTGAGESLRPLLVAVGAVATPEVAAPAVRPEDLREWRLRSETATSGTLSWFVELQRIPWRRRPRVLQVALWPSEWELRAAYPDLGPDRSALNDMRRRRLRRGLREVPQALRELVRRPR